MFLRLLLAFVLSVSFSSPLLAKWHVAESDHFVIYADQREADIRKFAQRLERFHAAMSFAFGATTKKPSPSNRVTVYVVSSDRKVQQLAGGTNRRVAGFYVPRAGGTLAVVPKLRKARSSADFSGETVLLHEYAHHFMYQITSHSWPRWFSEGFAEFFGSAKFFQDGAVGLGAPAGHRYSELGYGQAVPIELLLDTDGYAESKKRRYNSFYGQSWLLYHYLTFSAERQPQFNKYRKLLINGADEVEAAKSAFGDLRKLNSELRQYQKRKRLTYMHLKPEMLQTGPVAVRALRPGEAAVMPLKVQSKRGVTEEQAKELLPKIQAVADRHPGDAAVLAMLAEAEYDVGNHDAAIAAADRALAIDATMINAYVQKGYALAAKAKDSDGDAEQLWKETRKTFVALNRLENDHPIPLIWFYRTYVEQGKQPTELAIQGLEWALQLAPYDLSLRLNVAEQQRRDKRYAQAIKTLQPLVNSPHENAMTRRAEKILASIEANRTDRTSSAANSDESAILPTGS